MNAFHENIVTCVKRCGENDDQGGGVTVCRHSKLNIIDCATKGLCKHPAGSRFRIRKRRDWSPGLGSDIARVTSSLGIPFCSKCSKRAQRLNRLFPRR